MADEMSCDIVHQDDLPVYIRYSNVHSAFSKEKFCLKLLFALVLLISAFYLNFSFMWIRVICLVVSAILSYFLLYQITWTVRSETLIMTVPCLVQMETKYISGLVSLKYIPWNDLKSLAIVEIISGQSILFHLSAILNHCKDHVLLFEESNLRLGELTRVYKQLQGVIDKFK